MRRIFKLDSGLGPSAETREPNLKNESAEINPPPTLRLGSPLYVM